MKLQHAVIDAKAKSPGGAVMVSKKQRRKGKYLRCHWPGETADFLSHAKLMQLPSRRCHLRCNFPSESLKPGVLCRDVGHSGVLEEEVDLDLKNTFL